ncbi:hypothetical protein [Nocardia sp. CA-290969]|uniref:hypothetical protein n=1 Tax=Nocardia sp. CA-290969 TaxID=3239986 RepID=UPI003D8E2671
MTEKPAEPDSGADDAKSGIGETVSGDAKSAGAAAGEAAVAGSGAPAVSEPEEAPTGSAVAATTGSVPDAATDAVADSGRTVSIKKVFAGRGMRDATGPRRVGPRALIAALAVSVLLLVGAVGAAGYLFVQERDKAEILAAHDEVRQAACRYAPVLANYDAKNLDPYFSAVLAGATGDWKKEFETTTTELREALVAGQVVSTAGDIQCAVKSADTASAEVVVVIGQTVTSLGTQGQPAPGQLAMVMRMQKTDGHWLVDRMTSPLATPLP